MKQLKYGYVLLLCFAGIFAGCATMTQKTPLASNPLITAVGRRGELFLSLNGNQWYEPKEIVTQSSYMRKYSPITFRPMRIKATQQEITLAKVKSETGRTIGKHVMPVYSGDILIDSLNRELTAAGYTVKMVRKLPKDVGSGIDVSGISADLEQTTGLLTFEGTCYLQIKIDILHNGIKLSTHDYFSKISDYSITDQHQLLLKLMMKAAQNIVVESVPDIIVALSALHK